MEIRHHPRDLDFSDKRVTVVGLGIEGVDTRRLVRVLRSIDTFELSEDFQVAPPAGGQPGPEARTWLEPAGRHR